MHRCYALLFFTANEALIGRESSFGIQTSFASPNDDDSKKDGKEHWDSNTAFLFAAIGAAVGLGNVVRFPYLLYKNGGAAFLIPYTISLFVVGLPILGMELMLGQTMQKGPIQTLGKVHPRLWGVGAVACFTAFWTIIYYNVVMAWTWVYLYHSFSSPLPWGTTLAESRAFQEVTILGKSGVELEPGFEPLSNGLGNIHWPVVLALFIQWTTVFLCCFKGVKGVGKVVMVTMPLPGIMLLVLVIYGSTLEGAIDGVKAYIGSVDTSKLAEPGVWVDALSQIFFGLSMCSGGMITYGASQPRNAKTVSNTWTIGLADSFFSLMSGFAIYTIIAHLAFEEGNSIDAYEDDIAGYTLSFVTFPVVVEFYSRLHCTIKYRLFSSFDGL